MRLLATAQVSERSFRVFFDQVEQLRQRLLQLRQENRNLVVKNRALKKQVGDLQAKLSASQNHCALCNNAVQLVPKREIASDTGPVSTKAKRAASFSKEKLRPATGRIVLPARKINFIKIDAKQGFKVVAR